MVIVDDFQNATSLIRDSEDISKWLFLLHLQYLRTVPYISNLNFARVNIIPLYLGAK